MGYYHSYGHTGIVLDATLTNARIRTNYDNKMYVIENNRPYSRIYLLGLGDFKGALTTRQMTIQHYRSEVSIKLWLISSMLGANLTTTSEVVATYSSGETVILDNWYTIKMVMFGEDIRQCQEKTRYVAIGRSTGKQEK